jgi:RNA polymerase sigma-70 factor, ECF subfamily
VTDEADLIARAQAGEAAAFEEILSRHGRALYQVAFAILGTHEDAEDALQEVAIRSLHALRRFDRRRPLIAWLRRIMVNECYSRLRRPRTGEWVDTETPATDGLPHRDTESAETVRQVRQALETLPARQRVAVVLVGFDGMDQRAAAEAMGCSVGALKSHLHRARGKLKSQLRDLLPPEVVGS